MVDEIIPGQNKRLSEQSRVLLRELEKMAVSASRIIPELYANLKDDGFDPSECRAIIEEKIQVSQQWIRRLLPAEARQFQRASPAKEISLAREKQNTTLASDTVAQPERIIEVRPTQAEPKPEPKMLEVTLSKKEFETDIRMFLLNRQQQSLTLEVDVERKTVVRVD